MPQKALPKKVDKVDQVSRFRDNIFEDIPQAGSEEQEEETFVPEDFWKDVHKQFKNSQMLAVVKLKDKMSRSLRKENFLKRIFRHFTFI
jgi:hypothetical protein